MATRRNSGFGGGTRIVVGTNAGDAKGVIGRRAFTGGGGRFVTRRQKYGEVRRGLGLVGG